MTDFRQFEDMLKPLPPLGPPHDPKNWKRFTALLEMIAPKTGKKRMQQAKARVNHGRISRTSLAVKRTAPADGRR